MRGNQFGKLFSMTTFGESHGPAMGVIIDGVPAGLDFNIEKLEAELQRRAPGKSATASARKEADKPEILSGIFQNKTLGTPICVMIKNTDAKSEDYESWKDENRPGHADETTILKYGIRDYRGGGRASGRETVARVVAGYFASLVLPEVQFTTYISQLGPFQTKNIPESNMDLGKFYYPDKTQWQEIENYLLECKKTGNSAGGTIQVTINNVPAGLGEPVFDKLKADFAKALLSIGSCVGFTYGMGQDFATTMGTIATSSQENFGGIEGGISNGGALHLTCFFRAPSTVGKKAQEGRHDPCILPRVIPVVESMCRIVISDHFLRQNAYQIKPE